MKMDLSSYVAMQNKKNSHFVSLKQMLRKGYISNVVINSSRFSGPRRYGRKMCRGRRSVMDNKKMIEDVEKKQTYIVRGV